MTKCKRRLLPAEPYEIDALESWFSDLSAEGLHVQKEMCIRDSPLTCNIIRKAIPKQKSHTWAAVPALSAM